ncbi:Cdp-alcohol phosphatidyltransferase [Apiospora arundinis]|uniref:Cdp-alcohol phosphatidyltransferase n=1 Tax=Apiospora arundinis TaxID=335852 RepID=A0ABR2IS47_9PEZI
MSSGASPTIDPSIVPLKTRQGWCLSELNVCGAVCTRIGVVLANGNSTQTNTCDTSSLKYECLCARNVEPNIGAYRASMPALMCNEANKECTGSRRTPRWSAPIRLARLQDVEPRQNGCTSSYQCGTLDTPATDTTSTSTKIPSTTTTSSPSSTSARTATSTSTAASSTNIAPVVPSETNTSVPESPPSSGQGLSTGAKAGIGVGSALGGILIFALLAYWFYCFKGRKQGSKAGNKHEGYNKAELADTQTLGHGIPQELDAPAGESEMAHTQEPTRPPVELG